MLNRFQWDFHWISMGVDFNGISTGFQWNCYGMLNRFQWDFHWISMGVSWDVK